MKYWLRLFGLCVGLLIASASPSAATIMPLTGVGLPQTNWTLVTSVKASGNNAGGPTTSAVNTVGANLIVISVAYPNDIPTTISDNQGNTYTALTVQISSFSRTRLYYVYNPTTSSSHRFTSSGGFSAIAVAAFSGPPSSSFDVENGATITSAVTSIGTGSITPAGGNELVIIGGGPAESASSLSASNGFTIAQWATFISGQAYSVAIAYKIQPATSISSTWSWTTSSTACATIAGFKGH